MSKHQRVKNVFFILTIIVGLLAVAPQVFYQSFLFQGDHGRDLYISQQTAQGAIPYVDYRTDNGPAMPFYYGAFLAYLGNSIQSVLLGYALMIFIAGLLIFLIARKVIPPHFAFFSSILCMLIRPDIGLASLAGLLICSFIYQRKDYLPNRSFFIILLTALAGTFVMANLFIPEMFSPYWNSIQWNLIPANLIYLLQYSFSFLTQNLAISGLSAILAILFFLGTRNLWISRKNKETKKCLRHLTCFLIFLILFLMEFLLGFRFFRWIWILPQFFLIMFYCIFWGIKDMNKFIQGIIFLFLIFICSTLVVFQYADIQTSKKNNAVLSVDKTHLYMRPTQKSWIDTVEKTSQFILQATKPEDVILTLPYDSLYCFLTQRKLATKNPSLIGSTGTYVIPELEKNQVPLIVISNRAFHHNEEHLYGTLGRDYGKDLWEYIQTNYFLAAQFGPWNNMAGPVQNHATQIYLRKTAFESKASVSVQEIKDDL